MEHARAQGNGDCWRTCLAAILERPAKSVPHFVDIVKRAEKARREDSVVPGFIELTREWLEREGFGLLEVPIITRNDQVEVKIEHVFEWAKAYAPGVYYILCGSSSSPEYPNDNHAVVCLDDKIVYDPSQRAGDSQTIKGACEGSKAFWLSFILDGSIVATKMNTQPAQEDSP